MQDNCTDFVKTDAKRESFRHNHATI